MLDRPAPRELTVRAVLTGSLLGGVLSLCNVYAGLKVGWGFNMAVTAGLLAYGLWRVLRATAGAAPFGVLENNINVTAASAAASISSSGLSAGIPALAMMTGQRLSYPVLVVWTFAVSIVGVVVAVGLRRQFLEVDKLTFPSGVATAETLKEVYAEGRDALARVKVLGAGALASGALKVAGEALHLKHALVPLGVPAGGALAARGVAKVSLANLTFTLEPSLLMVGVGAIIGLRACASILVGSVVAWGVVAPRVLALGWAQPGPLAARASWFGPVVKWLLWPGVTMMVVASLTSFAFSWRSLLASLRAAGGASRAARHDDDRGDDRGRAAGSEGEGASAPRVDDVPRRHYLVAAVASLGLAVVCQVAFFGIRWWVAVLAALLAFVLAVVAGRVSGETGITPIGAMGKVAQLIFGAIAPGNAAANLMTANVTGGSASHCADLLHDLKTGALLGASPRRQAIAQLAGVASGALLGSWGYLVLIRDPARELMTDAWPAPAVATWRAVAEVFMRGLGAMPRGSVGAIVAGAAVGFALAVLEKTLPRRYRGYVPSPASVGLAFTLPAYNALSIAIGGFAAAALARGAPSLAARYLTVLAAGLIAGESLAGVGVAVAQLILR